MASKQPPRKLLRKRPRPSYNETTSDDEGHNCSSSGDTNFSNESRPFGALPKNVSDWTIFDLDKLAIFYDRTAKPTPSDVLQLVTDKTGFYGNLTIEQQEVMKVIIDNLDFDLKIEEQKLKQQQYVEGIITELRLTEDKLQKQMEPISSHKQNLPQNFSLHDAISRLPISLIHHQM
ncbi:uncharacterized protein [Mytilus edulis]|uniref:uncharacterized protein n=1 Tax=Mytilus edulis TaxID=6550 RepID=UPI0039F05A60